MQKHFCAQVSSAQIFGDSFAASRRNEAKNVGLELQMCALNSRQDNSMYFRLLKIGSAMMEGLTGYLR